MFGKTPVTPRSCCWRAGPGRPRPVRARPRRSSSRSAPKHRPVSRPRTSRDWHDQRKRDPGTDLMSAAETISQAPDARRKVLFSPGFRKCATSTMHKLLRENAETLAPYFRFHARDGLTESWRDELHAITFNDDWSRVAVLPDVAKRLAEKVEAMPPGPVFITDENLIGFRTALPDGRTIFDVAAIVLPILQDAFSDMDIAFRFQTRDHDEWILSTYKHDVVHHGEHRKFPAYARTLPQGLDWETGRRVISAALSVPVSFVDVADDRIGTAPGRSVMTHFDLPAEVVETLKVPRNANIIRKSVPIKRRENARAVIKRRLMTGFGLFGASAADAAKEKAQ